MTPQQANPPRRKQVNANGGIGFQDGVHHHHYDSYPAGAAVAASRDATNRGVTVGPPVTEWGPSALGVHDSITVHQEIILTPYLARPHDHQLRELLIRAKKSDRPAFLLVVGTSCTGKTRTLYEAVTAVLPDWQLTAPRHDNVLVRLLMDGIPSRTIVWLDELQDLLPGTPEGIRAAKAIVEMLNATVGPILFASTIWPTNHAAMQARPEPDKAATGVGAIPHLLTRVSIIEVPGIFTDADLPDEPELDDPRLRKARDAAARTEHGRKITQVLAGGTQLVDRLYPPKDSQATDRFSPSASAVLRAAADLRRVGLPNPIPRWAIEGAAAGYLDPPDPRPPELWLPGAIDETTQAARHDDPLTGTRTHDIHHFGVPALTPRWTNFEGERLEAYELHEFLLQDHLIRHRCTPTREPLWDTLTSRDHTSVVAVDLAAAAGARGLLTTAVRLIIEHAYGDDWKAPIMLADLLLERRAKGDVEELWWLSQHAGTYTWLPQMLQELGDDDLLVELFGRAGSRDSANAPSSHVLSPLEQADPVVLARLRESTHAGTGGRALLAYYRKRHPQDIVLELDCDANPVIAT